MKTITNKTKKLRARYNRPRPTQWLFAAALLCLSLLSCEEKPFMQTPTDSVAPPPVSNVVATPIPGGARITYDLPSSDLDLSYVKAEYTYRGIQKVLRASIYNNFVLLEGLGDTEPVNVTLFLVDHSENVSAGQSVTFTPQTPPFVAIFESIELLADFGGVKIKWLNETNTEIGLTVLIEDSLGIMREQQTRYSRDRNGEIVFRGYDPKEYHFAVRLTDKWGNNSDTKDATLIPLYEKSLSKTRFLEVGLPGDNTSTSNNRPFSRMWDGSISSIWHTLYPSEEFSAPHYVTLDLGVEAKLSRVKVWTRPNYWYGNYSWREFELWACKNYQQGKDKTYWTGQDAWKDDWEFLGLCEIKRPSGATDAVNVPTGMDLDAANAGFEFIVALEAADARYLRFKVLRCWTANAAMHMGELEVFGDDHEREEVTNE